MILSIPKGYKIIKHGLKAHSCVVLASAGDDHDNIFRFISPENIVKLAYRFFKDYDCELNGSRYIVVLFSPENIKMKDHEKNWQGGEEEYLAGSVYMQTYEDGKAGFVRIYFNHSSSVSDFLKVFFHELDHVLWNFQGNEYLNEGPYMDRPHERRAYAVGKRWLKKLRDEDIELHIRAEKLRNKARMLLVRQGFILGFGLGIHRKIASLHREARKIEENCLFLCDRWGILNESSPLYKEWRWGF